MFVYLNAMFVYLNAFEKVKVKTIVGIPNDDELSSDTEYYADDD